MRDRSSQWRAVLPCQQWLGGENSTDIQAGIAEVFITAEASSAGILDAIQTHTHVKWILTIGVAQRTTDPLNDRHIDSFSTPCRARTAVEGCAEVSLKRDCRSIRGELRRW